MADDSDTSDDISLVSVVIPVPADPDRAVETIEKVNKQTWEQRETVIVCSPDTELESTDYPRTRVVQEQQCENMAQLINSGMNAAKGDVCVLLMPNCLPADDQWLTHLVAPFEDPEVSAVVSQCEGHETRESNLPARLMECVESPQIEQSDAEEAREIHLLSHLCDAFRADIVTPSDDLYHTGFPTPGEAVDLSVRISSANHKMVLSPRAKVFYYDPPRTRSLKTVLHNALHFGRADALLGKTHNIDWIGSRTYAAAVLSFLALPVALIDIPIAVIFTLIIFAWCWFLPLRVPLLKWEMPVSVLHIGVYAAIVLSIRGHWAPFIFPPQQWHPAVIRQWCFVTALPLSFLLILFYDGIRSAIRGLKDLRGIYFAPTILVLSMLWNLISGIGYMAGYFMGHADTNEEPA